MSNMQNFLKIKVFSMRSKLILIACLMTLALPFTAFAKAITKVVITTVEPAVGETPSLKATVPETASTEVAEVSWSGEFDGDKFIQGNNYTITVKIKVKESSVNTFSTSYPINATINGKKARVTNIGAKNISVKYTWKTLGGENPNTPQYKIKARLAELARRCSII